MHLVLAYFVKQNSIWKIAFKPFISLSYLSLRREVVLKCLPEILMKY